MQLSIFEIQPEVIPTMPKAPQKRPAVSVTEYNGTKESCDYCAEDAEWVATDKFGYHHSAWCDDHLAPHLRKLAIKSENPLTQPQLRWLAQRCANFSYVFKNESPAVVVGRVLREERKYSDQAANQLLQFWLETKPKPDERLVKTKKRKPKSGDKTCPRCGHQGDIAEDFGYRVVNGKQIPQSWCRSCR